MFNVYIPPPYAAEPNSSVRRVWAAFGCAGQATRVDAMRGLATFLWMSDLFFAFEKMP